MIDRNNEFDGTVRLVIVRKNSQREVVLIYSDRVRYYLLPYSTTLDQAGQKNIS